jgi:hypothetical protein
MNADNNNCDIDKTIEVTGLSRRTILRYIKSGKFVGAYKDKSTKKWLIPSYNLVHLGLDKVTQQDDKNELDDIRNLLKMRDLEIKLLKEQIQALTAHLETVKLLESVTKKRHWWNRS